MKLIFSLVLLSLVFGLNVGCSGRDTPTVVESGLSEAEQQAELEAYDKQLEESNANYESQ